MTACTEDTDWVCRCRDGAIAEEGSTDRSAETERWRPCFGSANAFCSRADSFPPLLCVSLILIRHVACSVSRRVDLDRGVPRRLRQKRQTHLRSKSTAPFSPETLSVTTGRS